MKQLELSLDPAETVNRNGLHNSRIPARKATFKGGLDQPFHRWMRLTPSFGPELVDHMLTRMNVRQDALVLDPFAGAGTTLIQCKLHGIPSVGFEINPFLHFAGNACLNWTVDPNELRQASSRLEELFTESSRESRGVPLSDLALEPPPIHNIHRWWREDVLREILILRDLIDGYQDEPALYHILRLCLLAVLVPDLTNVTLGRLQLHFIDRSDDEIQVWRTYKAHLDRIISDLERSTRLASRATMANVVLTNATDPDTSTLERPVDFVVTSPPYPNRYSYVWNTRPHLYMGGFITKAKEASSLDIKTIGGTWGTATSRLAKGEVAPRSTAVGNVVSSVAREIRESDNLMANYVVEYFNLLQDQVVSLEAIGSQEMKVAYVVGCSRLKGVFVETDVLLGSLFEELGFSLESIERFRRRNSGKNLHESVVYASVRR
jgi:hypothetical protein